jgi:hypothetical protein
MRTPTVLARSTLLPALVILVLVTLSACDLLGIEDPAKVAALKEAEGKAIGSACRQTGRALEDCYDLNSRALKSAIFAGWREMDGYMRENKLEVVPRQPPDAPAKGKDGTAAAEPATGGKAGKGEKPAEKLADKLADKPAEKLAAKVPEKSAAKH